MPTLTTGSRQLPNPTRTLELDLLVQLALVDEASDLGESHLAFAHLVDTVDLLERN